MIRNVFFWLVCFFEVVLGLLFSPLILLSPDRGKLLHPVMAVFSRLDLWIAGVKLSQRGLENIPPEDGLIFACNHQSMVDVLVALAYLPKYSHFVVMEQVYAVPLLNLFMDLAGYVRVNQGNAKESVFSVMKIIRLMKRGENIMIFPEGTRTLDGKINKFKDGVAMLIIKSKNKVVPMAIAGSMKIMHKHELKVHPGPVKLIIGKPLEFPEIDEVSQDNIKLVTHRLEEAIESLFKQIA